MKALIFAAGRGERMRPLTDHTAKPLLMAGGKRLIEWQIEALVRAGVRELVINLAHLAEQFEPVLGNGARFDARIVYSREGNTAEEALETLGGIVKALPLLGGEPFLAVAGDIVTDYDYRHLTAHAQAIALGAADAHLVLVDNPPYHPGGDMDLREGRIAPAHPRLTFASIAVFAPRLFAHEAAVKKKLFPWLYQYAERGRVTGTHYSGVWHNVGTPADLERLDTELRARAPG
ncbi:MAG TPA: nucleotidyltransferase family protein [Burkholderiaceae bacterium]|nr:nucleotidyltransferase family protein [Burkholderiaceae bacterium]